MSSLSSSVCYSGSWLPGKLIPNRGSSHVSYVSQQSLYLKCVLLQGQCDISLFWRGISQLPLRCMVLLNGTPRGHWNIFHQEHPPSLLCSTSYCTAAPWTEGDDSSTVKFSVQVPWLEQMPVDSFTSVFHLSCHPGCVLDPSLLPVGNGKHHGLFRMRC